MLRIKEIAKQKGYKLTEVADKLNIGRSAFSQMISGNPTVETLDKIATALGVEIQELFTPPTNKPENIVHCPNCGAKLKIDKI